MKRIPLPELADLCTSAVIGAGGSLRTAHALATATIGAERRGHPEVGAAHLPDYLAALEEGRLNGHAEPAVRTPRPAIVLVDAQEGTAQLAFEAGVDALLAAARTQGVAVLGIGHSFSAGELAHYTHRVAENGLIALAFANSSPLMAAHGATAAVTGTNPMAFAVPHPAGPRGFDQAASAAAWVRIRDAAQQGEPIPPAWALDADGEPTTDPGAALEGALLPFGGVKGSNIALMVELLAVLAGGSFSIDAAPFDSGDRSPRLGLFVAAIDPEAFDPEYPARVENHVQRLAREHGAHFGRRKAAAAEATLTPDLYARLTEAAARSWRAEP